jgi:hypothetical protein
MRVSPARTVSAHSAALCSIVLLVLVCFVTALLLFVYSVRFARQFGCSRQAFASCLSTVRLNAAAAWRARC